MVKEAYMPNQLLRWVLPAALAAFTFAPASAQVRAGVNLPGLHIRVSPDAPPPPRVEVRPSRPGRNHVWIGGYWDRQDDRWAWAPGRWEEPAERNHHWIKAKYHREYGSYRYEPGHWSHQKLEEGDDYRRFHEEHRR
jgi:hypothetical protein